MGTSKNSHFCVRARKPRAQNHRGYENHEDSSTGLTPLSRKKGIFSGAIMFVLWLLSGVALAAIEVVDDSGVTLRLAQPAQRVVSLAPHLTELMFAVGAGSKLVGVVDHSDYPAAAKKIPIVGGYNNIDLEVIVSMKPDLIVAWQSGNSSRQLETLKQLGFKVFINEPRHLQDVPATAMRLAQLVGLAKRGRTFAASYTQTLARLRQTYSGKKSVSLFYQIWNEPLMTINGKHIISDVMRLCGARNVFADGPTLAMEVSLESVLAARPQMIIASGMGQQRPQWLQQWLRWEQLPAVKHDQLYFINPDVIQRHGPRILQAAQTLCQQVELARAVYH